MNHTIGKMHQFLAWQLPIFKKIGGRPFAYLKQNDIVVFLSGTDQYVKVLTSDGFVGTVPYFPKHNHWVEYKG